VVSLDHHLIWGAIGASYDDFRQVGDEEVIGTLARFAPPAAERGPEPGRAAPPPSA
jgi:predicted phosphoribosyltransferase